MSTAAPLPETLSAKQASSASVDHLPDDPATLKRMILELLACLHERDRNNAELRERLDRLIRRLYGPKTERFDPNQPTLFGDATQTPTPETPAAPASEPESPATKRTAKPHGRRRLPDHLPRKPEHHELSEAERICTTCGTPRIDIGVDKSEQADYQPATFFVTEHLVHKYLCPCCAKKEETGGVAQTAATEAATHGVEPAPLPVDTTAVALAGPSPLIISASRPALLLPKCLAGPGMLAYLIVSKFADHLPLYRLEHICARQGLELTRSTMCDWLAACAQALRPLYERMVALVLQSRFINTDDTPVKIHDPTPGGTETGRIWSYLGDLTFRYNVFDFTPNRKRDGPQRFLKDYQGYLQADAFSGYDRLYLPDPVDGCTRIIEVACNAHARRKFVDARTSDELRACQALAYYGQLYDIERRAKDVGEAQRLRMRQDLAVPILNKLKTWLDQQKGEVLPKSPLAEAIGYALNNWTALVRYAETGFLAIDNNVAEREMKRIAIGRKNWLFFGTENGGNTAAVLMSFTSTCKRLGVEPWAYLKDVITRLPLTPPDQLDDLLPDRWQAAHAKTAPPAPSTP
jgi:transposase